MFYLSKTFRSHLETKLKVFNQYYEGKSGGIRSREVNGRLILEGALRIYWGVRGVIHLKEDDDQRTVVTARNRNSCRRSVSEVILIFFPIEQGNLWNIGRFDKRRSFTGSGG